MNPSEAGALLAHGVEQFRAGAGHDAISTLRRAAALEPGNALVWNTLGAVLVEMGDSAEAERALNEALRLQDDYCEARFNLAISLAQRQKLDEARAELTRIIERWPDFAPARVELAANFVDSGDAKSAWPLLGALVESFPEDGRIRAIAGDALALVGRHAQAQAQYAAAVVKRPRDAPLLGKLGLASLAAGKHAQAAEAFREQARLRPDFRPAYQNFSLALMEMGRPDEAMQALSAALLYGHRDGEILATLVNLKGQVCDWEGLAPLVEELRRQALQPSEFPAHPQAALYLPEVGAREQRTWAEHYARVRFADKQPVERSAAPPSSGVLRIGYVSSDFHDHAVAWLMVGLLEHHDRSRYRITAYSAGPDHDSAVRRRIAQAVDVFVDIRDMTARAAAERVAADGIDVLIDLGGYTRRSRLEVLAYRPAPLQAHFLGYPATTGAPFVDFYIGDAIACPAGSEASFSEKLLRLPGCLQPNDPRRALPAPRPRATDGLPEDAIVFSAFCQAVKIRPDTFEQWCALLQAVPKGVLWLRDPGAAASARLKSFAQARGIDPARLIFAGHVPSQDDHMSRLANADIALDTYPYGSHTTASDALWAGVPLISAAGETFASRVAASILAAAGCADWAFANPRAAFEATVAIARDPRALAQAQARAAASRASPLFDAARFAAEFEAMIAAART